jgi:hypothetical protein
MAKEASIPYAQQGLSSVVIFELSNLLQPLFGYLVQNRACRMA